jgi:hypothetical protein
MQNRLNEGSSTRDFQERWNDKSGIIKNFGRTSCALYSESAVCRSSFVKRHYETVHKSLCDKKIAKTKKFSRNKKCVQMFDKICFW